MRSIFSLRHIFGSLVLGFAVFGLAMFIELVWPIGIEISWRIPLLLTAIFYVVFFFAPEKWR
jgi:hypothetical protein